jgi:hypothetical protein
MERVAYKRSISVVMNQTYQWVLRVNIISFLFLKLASEPHVTNHSVVCCKLTLSWMPSEHSNFIKYFLIPQLSLLSLWNFRFNSYLSMILSQRDSLCNKLLSVNIFSVLLYPF